MEINDLVSYTCIFIMAIYTYLYLPHWLKKYLFEPHYNMH